MLILFLILQFLIQTAILSGGCDERPKFVNDTPTEGTVFNMITGPDNTHTILRHKQCNVICLLFISFFELNLNKFTSKRIKITFLIFTEFQESMLRHQREWRIRLLGRFLDNQALCMSIQHGHQLPYKLDPISYVHWLKT